MKRVFALLLALAVVFSLTACGKAKAPEKAKKAFADTFSSPEEFYRAVEKRNVNSVSDALDNTAGLADKMFSLNSDNAVQGSLTVSVGKDITDLLAEYVGQDMSWLKNAGLTFTLDRTHKDMTGAKATVQLNGTDLVNMDGLYVKDSHMAYIQMPEFSKQYAGVDVEQLLDDYYWENGYDQTYALLYSLVHGDDGQLQAIMGAMPDSETVSKLIDRYTEIVLKDLKDVKQGSEKVTANGVTCTYTTLTVEMDKDSLMTILKDVTEAAAKDEDIKTIICNLAEASGEDGDQVYESFKEELLNADLTIDEDVNIVMVVYVNDQGDVKGRDIQIKAADEDPVTVRFIYAEKDGKFGVDFLMESSEATMTVTGGGTRKDGHIKGTADADFTVNGDAHKLGTFEIDGDTKDNRFVGEISFTPSQELLDEVLADADLPSFLEDMVRNAKISFTNHSTKDHLDMTIAIKSGSSELISLRFECQETSPMSLSVPSDYLSPEKWAETIDQNGLVTLLGSLQDAGVPMSFFSEMGDLF